MNDEDTLDLAPETAPREAEKSGFWGKLKKGLFMTHTEFLERVGGVAFGVGIDRPDGFLDDPEHRIFFRAEEVVEAPGAHACPVADGLQCCAVEACFAEQLPGRIDDARFGSDACLIADQGFPSFRGRTLAYFSRTWSVHSK